MTARAAAGTRNHPFSERLQRTFVVAAAGIFVTFVTLLVGAIAAQRADRWAAHSRDVARIAREIGALARDRETGIRGYLLTRDRRSLDPDTEAGPPLRAALDSLAMLTLDNVRQRRQVDALVRAIDAWERRFATPVRLGRAVTAEASEADTSLAGKPLFDAVRRELATFLAEEDRLYAVRRARLQRLGFAIGALVLGELLLLALLIERYRRLLVHQGVTIEEQQYALESQAVELEMQSEDVQRANAELVAANDELQAFAYSVAHDLRAPVRTINGFAGMLTQDYGPSMSDEGRRMLGRIRRATVHAGELIDGLLALARLRRDELKRTTVDLGAISAQVVEDLQRSEPERAVEVQIGERLVATGDPRLLPVVMQNLIGNAWKFTRDREPGRIEIGRTTVEGKGRSAFFVRDNGVGFDQSFASQLFGTFVRLHAGEFPGTGIGLATVRRIVERHGGEVWAEGRAGAGATFYFTLPDSEPTQRRA